MDIDKIVIIFSGYNNRAIVSFIRTLEKNKITYAIVAKNNDDPMFWTSYKNNIILTRKNQSLDLELFEKVFHLARVKFSVTQYIIAPSTEALNRFLLNERIALEAMNAIVPLPEMETYLSVSDKKAFSDMCRNNNIFVPAEYDSISDAKFPFVAKPRKYFTKDGSVFTPFLIFDYEQKISFLKECDPDSFYFQEYVEGRSIYLLYYFHRNGNIEKFSQENIIQQPDGGSIVAAISSDFHNNKESINYEKLFNLIGFVGLVMVELKVSDNRNYMIEANPRFWGPSQLFVDADFNLFEYFLHDYGCINGVPMYQHPVDAKYFWFGGALDTFKKSKTLSFHVGCEKDFLMSIDTWLECDIYKRIDSIGVFKEEIR